MIQINPLKSYIDGGVRAALTTPPSASLVFDLPGKAIWVKGVKLKGTDHTYTFSHDNYITLTNTPDSNESEDIKIGVNTSALKNAIDTTYGVVSTTTNGLAPKFTSENKLAASTATTYYFLGWAGSTLKWYQAPFRNIRINSETTDCLGVNNTDPLIISSGNGISVTWDSTNKKIIITNTKPDVNHNTDTKVALSVTTLDKNYAVILKGNDSDEGSITTVNFSTYLKFNPSTKQLTINGSKVITSTDIYTGSNIGLVPAATSAQLNYFLRGDGTWVNIATVIAATNTWRPIKIENTDALGSETDTGTLSFAAGTGITLAWDATNKRIIITNSSPDQNHNTDENIRQVPKTDNINRPIMMINGDTSTGEQINTSTFSTGIYANTSTKMITANGFIKAGSSDNYVLLGGGGHKTEATLSVANADTLDGYHESSFLRYSGSWSSDSGLNVDDASGMIFAYNNHGVPDPWGVVTTFEPIKNSNYKHQIYADCYFSNMYYRVYSGDRGGWYGGWKHLLDSSNYTSYTVKKDGTGATGTWNINISGNAATATNTDMIDGQHLITPVSDWNTDSLSIFKSSENLTSNAPNGDYIYGATLRFHRDTDTYHTDIVTCLYYDALFFRRKTEAGYHTWRELIHSGNIGSQSVNYANSAGNADTIDNLHSTGFLRWKGMLNIGYNAPFQAVVDIMKDTSKLNDGGLAFYSHVGDEYTVLIGSRNDAARHGNALKWGYANKYLWMIRMINGSPISSDWEKISAGYADSAGNADTLDGIDSTGFLRYYNSNSAPSNVDIVNTPSYVWTVSTTGGSVANATKPSGMDNAWGVIHLHTHVGNYATQLGFGGTTGRMYMRNAYCTSTFGNWQALAFTTDNVASASKLQTARTIWGQSFDGTANIDNTLRIRQTTSNYCEGIRIQTADGAWSTIILGATADTGTNTNAWSIHRKNDNNFAISRNSSDGVNGLVMTSTGMGLGTTAPTFRLDVRGTIRSTDRIYANEWIQFDNWTGLYSPNNNAHFYPNNTTSYGQWQLRGNRNGYSGIHFGDSTYYMTIIDSGTHKGLYSEGWGNWILYFNLDSKRLGLRTSSLTSYAVTCDGDFYCRSGWLRTEGTTGWYNESYGGGWYMTDTSWMRSYSGKGVVAGGFYHSSYGSSEYVLTSDGGARYLPNLYDGRYLRYEGWWNDGSGQNVNDSLGMTFTYTNHGAPHHWGTTVTFEYERSSSYRLQLHGTGDNYLYFRNRSADYGGWHSSGWKQILTNRDTYVANDGTNRGIINGSEVASARHLLINGATWNSDWHWSGQGGQPSWLWGSNDGTNMYVWNPSNFSVNYANSAGNADTVDGNHASAFATANHTHIDTFAIGYNPNYVILSFRDAKLSKKASETYIECWDSDGGWWNWMANKWIKVGSDDSYVLLGGGGHKAESSLSVNYASSAGYANSADRANYLSGHGVSPNNSHPGHGARVFYSWNIGQAGNDTSGYSNGITIGSHPGDTGYGFQIVQNMWDDRTYTRRYNGGWQSWKTLAWTSDIPTKSSWNYDDVYSKLGHTHDDRYYTESEINTKLGTYLPLSGGTMTGNITYTGLGTSYIGKGSSDGANGVGGTLNNLVISSWYGVSFTTSCSVATYTNKNAVSIDCRYGYVYANTFVGTLSGNATSATSAINATNADTVDGYHASAFATSGHNHDSVYAKLGAHNNLTASGNEFTFASSGFSGGIYLNYRTAGGLNGNITSYVLGNGKGGSLGTIIHSGNIGSQSVSYATSSSQVKDAGNNTAITFKYSSGGFTSNPTWLAAWNGYQLTYVSPSVLSVSHATTVTVNNSDSRSTYRMIWHSGNTLYSTSGIYCNPSTDCLYASHYYEASDIRYKRILRNLSINSNTIATLPLFDFEWIENNAIGTGTSALAVQQILPNIVSGTNKLTLDYGVLGTIAGITACKELVTLKSELLQLKEKVKLLEDKLRKYENI